MKKVLIFLDYYNNGGIEKVIEEIDRGLNKKYEIDILSFVNLSHNNKVKCLLSKNYRNFFIRNIFGLNRINKKIGYYDVIHINCYNAFGLVYAKKFKKYGKKIIVHAHNSDLDRDRDKFVIKKTINRLIKKVYSKNYTLVSCSKLAEDFCFSSSGIIIPNGIDYDKYTYNEKNRKIYLDKFSISGKKIIGNIGRFEKQKNHDFIINMFDKLVEIDDNYFLILIGEGTRLEYIKSRVNDLNLNDKVLFLGYRDDIDKLINIFDIFILPSLYEGFGISCVEAQINGKIVLISDNVSKDVIISNNTYSLELDVDKWVSAILNMNKKGLILDKRLNISSFINNINELYEE